MPPSSESRFELASPTDRVRQHSYGQQSQPTKVDKLGVWLSARQVRRHVRDFGGQDLGDFGCGYNASLVRSLLDQLSSAVLVDVALAGDLKSHPKVRAIEGFLPEAASSVPDASLDVILCLSVLEHVWEPLAVLEEFRRIGRPGSVCLINVPSWRGKWFLEKSAFKFGLSPAEEMDDHKAYYDPRDLWPLLVKAGWAPSNIRCFKHKFGLNTFAVCRKEQ